MVRELLLSQDEVGLPGLGSFVAELIPASFADRGYTINPPYRRISFMPGRSEDDSLVRLYAESNDIDFDQAKSILQHFLEETKRALLDQKTVVFPGLGRLRATRQNNIFFICEEDLDIYPDGFGLPSVSLKNHTETPEQLHHVVSELASIVGAQPSEPTQPSEPEPIEILDLVEPAETAPVTPAEPEPVQEPTPEPEPEPAPAEPEPKEPYTAPIALRETYEAPVSERQREIYSAPTSDRKREAYETPASDRKREPYETPTSERKREPYETPISNRKREKYRRPRTHRKISKWWWLGPILALVFVAVVLAVFLILCQVAPDFIDSILYTPEELQIINY